MAFLRHKRESGVVFEVKRCLILFGFLFLVVSTRATVRVYVEDVNGLAWIKYECTGGETVRAFALDVTVDEGRIVDISDFFLGQSTAAAQGYGIFPAAFRDHITIGPGTNVDWNAKGYTPLAVVADNPSDTLPGLGSGGVTLEFGALWDPADPAAIPGPAGSLCALHISDGATVSVKANLSRGGVVASNPDVILATEFSAAFVQPPEITGMSVTNNVLTVAFAGGELETAPTIDGPWTGTANSSGQYAEAVGNEGMKFYRVRAP